MPTVLQTITAQAGPLGATCSDAPVLDRLLPNIPRMSHAPKLDCQLGKSVALSICHLQIP
jgi:hypothetical protein